MSLPSLTELQPYFTAAGAVLSLATLGFVMNVAKLMSDAAKMRAEVLEERVRRSEEELKRTEKWTEREKAELNREVEQLRAQLAVSLQSAGVSSTLDAREAVARISAELRATIDASLAELRNALAKRTHLDDDDSLDPALGLQLGQGYMATGHWELAVRYFDSYLQQNRDDWQVLYVKAVALANSRQNRLTNLAALRTLNDAIALALEPGSDADEFYRGRLFTYRGALLKRLGRLDEAESDIRLGATRAATDYEAADAAYNLASVFALRGDREQLLATLRSAVDLRMADYVAQSIRGHMDDYFRSYANDAEVKAALAALGESQRRRLTNG
jgi:tetratricopeptide (TPR) repeat protein